MPEEFLVKPEIAYGYLYAYINYFGVSTFNAIIEIIHKKYPNEGINKKLIHFWAEDSIDLVPIRWLREIVPVLQTFYELSDEKTIKLTHQIGMVWWKDKSISRGILSIRNDYTTLVEKDKSIYGITKTRHLLNLLAKFFSDYFRCVIKVNVIDQKRITIDILDNPLMMNTSKESHVLHGMVDGACQWLATSNLMSQNIHIDKNQSTYNQIVVLIE